LNIMRCGVQSRAGGGGTPTEVEAPGTVVVHQRRLAISGRTAARAFRDGVPGTSAAESPCGNATFPGCRE
jgi:hypothetical protein